MSRARNNSQGLYDQVQYLNGGQLGSMRNRAINGDMRIAQRATTYALTTTPAVGSIDRWAAYQGTAANGIFNQIQISQFGFLHYAKLGRNSGATGVGSVGISQALESYNSVPLQGQIVTLSFYAKAGANLSAVSNALSVGLYSGTGFDQSTVSMGAWTGNALPISSTVNLTTTLTRYQFTGTISGTASQLGINFAYTPVGTAGADDNIYITGVQLEVGSFATPFEFIPYGLELAICQRYFTYLGRGAAGGFDSATRCVLGQDFPVSMRTTPTMTLSSSPVTVRAGNITTSSSGAVIAASYIDTIGGTLVIDGFTGQASQGFAVSTTTNWASANAEL